MVRVALFAAASFLAAGAADARTWIVGGAGADFPFIQPAIDAAASGDVIRVRPGVYRENLLIDKTLTVVGQDYPVLMGTGIGTVVRIAAPGCELRGFAIEESGAGETNEMDAAVQVTSDGNRVVDNRMRRVFYGVVLSNASRNEVIGNEIRGISERPFGRRGDGVYLYRAPDNLVARNRISGERDAIYFQYAPRGRAVDNVVSDSRYALHDMFSDDAVIARNELSDSAVGANVMNSRRILIQGNRIRRHRGVPGVGLTLKDCDDSTIDDNQIVENARGLLIDGSSANRFTGNTFRANDTAVTVFSSAERNAFGGNRFIDNWSDLILNGRDSGTRWSIDGRGNYWSRYRGFDFDGDGIGDAPHPALGAFERLEASTPAARMFLQSPVAAGLELAARLSGRTPTDAMDDKPLVTAHRAEREARRVDLRTLGALAVAASIVGVTRRRRSC